MGEGILDNRDTEHKYWLLFEPKDPQDTMEADLGNSLSIPSILALQLNRRLNHPPVQFICTANAAKDTLRSQVQGLASPLPGKVSDFSRNFRYRKIRRYMLIGVS